MRRIFLAALLSVGFLSAGALAASVRVEAPTPLGSSDQYEVRAAFVPFDDLNIGSTEGVSALYQRIEVASRAVCNEKAAHHMTSDLQRRYADCRAQAVSSAVAALPQLGPLTGVR